MDVTLRQPDPERHRRRIQLLAELAEAKAARARILARTSVASRLARLQRQPRYGPEWGRGIVALRRRRTG